VSEVLIIDKSCKSPFSHNPDDYKDGFLVLMDKPYGWTSADVVRKVKFTLKRHFHHEVKVGHAGTLDPLATGLLVLCVGKTTKMSESLQAEEKEYVAEFCTGATTPSFDMEKEIDATYPYLHITEDMVKNTLRRFEGEQEQLPPVFSAKYVEGIRAYEKARLGETVELKPAAIKIYSISLTEFNLPKMKIKVRCSKGTYIRALARDIGVSLESGAYLTALRRTASGGFNVEDSLSVEDFTSLCAEQ